MKARALLLFLKFPTPGRVKTRLAADLGRVEAAAIYRELVACVLANHAGLDADLRVHFDPPESREAVVAWIAPQAPSATFFLPQVAGDLGERLAQGFAAAFADGYKKVAAIGSDCIALNADHLKQAWAGLESHDVVLGPALDGGYYLIGTRSHQPLLFREIPWSTADTFAATLSAAKSGNLTVFELPRLSDIDTLDDWLEVARDQ